MPKKTALSRAGRVDLIERIDELDGKLRCFATVTGELARQQAAQAQQGGVEGLARGVAVEFGPEFVHQLRHRHRCRTVHGQRLQPKSYHALVDVYPEDKIAEYMANVRGVIANCMRVMPTHEEFIAKHCAAKPM